MYPAGLHGPSACGAGWQGGFVSACSPCGALPTAAACLLVCHVCAGGRGVLPCRRPDPQGVHPASQGGERMIEGKKTPAHGFRGPAGYSQGGEPPSWGRRAAGAAAGLGWRGAGGGQPCNVCLPLRPVRWAVRVLEVAVVMLMGVAVCVLPERNHPPALAPPHALNLCQRDSPTSPSTLRWARTGRTLRRIAWIPSCALPPSATRCWTPLHEPGCSCTAGGKCHACSN